MDKRHYDEDEGGELELFGFVFFCFVVGQRGFFELSWQGIDFTLALLALLLFLLALFLPSDDFPPSIRLPRLALKSAFESFRSPCGLCLGTTRPFFGRIRGQQSIFGSLLRCGRFQARSVLDYAVLGLLSRFDGFGVLGGLFVIDQEIMKLLGFTSFVYLMAVFFIVEMEAIVQVI